jgi:Ran GTPase-activating protein (RanGAP) involved in mRNA processing and transport
MKNHIKGSTMQLLAQLFQKEGKKLTLSIESCFLNSPKVLSQFFKIESRLYSLNLSDVGINDDHLFEVATFLSQSCPQLKVFHLQKNNIGLEGAMSLA